MKSRNLFLGIIFLFVGVVTLLATLDVIEFSWGVAWRLWPMLLILIGIANLPLRDGIKALLLIAALTIGVLLYRHEAENDSRLWFFSQNMTEVQVNQPCS